VSNDERTISTETCILFLSIPYFFHFLQTLYIQCPPLSSIRRTSPFYPRSPAVTSYLSFHCLYVSTSDVPIFTPPKRLRRSCNLCLKFFSCAACALKCKKSMLSPLLVFLVVLPSDNIFSKR